MNPKTMDIPAILRDMKEAGHEIDFDAILRDLKEAGLEFSKCVIAFGEDRDSNPYARAAAALHMSEGELEFDSTLVVSESSDGGAYVMGWQWVDNVDAGIAGEDEDDGEEVEDEATAVEGVQES